jgi:hypothetical protein
VTCGSCGERTAGPAFCGYCSTYLGQGGSSVYDQVGHAARLSPGGVSAGYAPIGSAGRRPDDTSADARQRFLGEFDQRQAAATPRPGASLNERITRAQRLVELTRQDMEESREELDVIGSDAPEMGASRSLSRDAQSRAVLVSQAQSAWQQATQAYEAACGNVARLEAEWTQIQRPDLGRAWVDDSDGLSQLDRDRR